MLRVAEIFASVPEYGPFAGRHCAIVRLAAGRVFFTPEDFYRAGWQAERREPQFVFGAAASISTQVVFKHVDALSAGELLRVVEASVAVCIEADDPILLPKAAGSHRIFNLVTPSKPEFVEPSGEFWAHLQPTDFLRFDIAERGDALWVQSHCFVHSLWERTRVELVSSSRAPLLDWLAGGELGVQS